MLPAGQVLRVPITTFFSKQSTRYKHNELTRRYLYGVMCSKTIQYSISTLFLLPSMFSFTAAIYFSGPVECQLIPNFPMAARSITQLPSDPDIAEIKFIGFFVNLTPN